MTKDSEFEMDNVMEKVHAVGNAARLEVYRQAHNAHPKFLKTEEMESIFIEALEEAKKRIYD